MSKHYSLSKKQLHLNLNRLESLFAEGLKTEEVSELLQILIKERVTPKDILKHGKTGRFEVRYLYGVLVILPSHKGKSGRFWQWDMIFSPVSLAKSSV